MEQRRFGPTGIRVSELCLGTMTFGREADEATSRAIVDRFLDAGGNFLDTADMYGRGTSEEIVGRSLEGRRDEVVLATKVRFPVGEGPNDQGASRRHIREGIEHSLRRLHTEWVDLYQIHCWDPLTSLEETLSTLDDLVREGKVRYIGASNYTGWQLAKALGVSALRGWEPFVCLQPQYSLVVRGAERELLPLCRAENLAVIPWSPLGRGTLTGKYKPDEEPPDDTRGADDPLTERLLNERTFEIVNAVDKVAGELGRSHAQVALQWVLSRPGVTAPIIGVRNLDQLEDNLGAAGWSLEGEHDRLLHEASRIDYGYPHDFQKWVGAR